MAHEQGSPAAFLGPAFGDYQGAWAPVERACQIALLVGAGRGNLGLLAASPPPRPDFGVGVDIDLVLEDGTLVAGQGGQELAQGLQLDCPLRLAWSKHRPGPPPYQLFARQP